MKHIYLLALVLMSGLGFAQVKIGSNPTAITPDVNLEIEATDGTKVIVNQADGKVGIGTTTVDAALHVVGDVKIIDGNQGTGKILTSDADGLATWTTAIGMYDFYKVGTTAAPTTIADNIWTQGSIMFGSATGTDATDASYTTKTNTLIGGFNNKAVSSGGNSIISGSANTVAWGNNQLITGNGNKFNGGNNPLVSGTGNTVTSGNNIAVLGQYNTHSGDNSLVFGQLNNSNNWQSLTFGESNTSGLSAGNSAVWGQNNSISYKNCAAWGEKNSLGGFSQNSGVWGSNNIVNARQSGVWGDNNKVYGYDDGTSTNNVTSFGSNNIINQGHSNSVAIGIAAESHSNNSFNAVYNGGYRLYSNAGKTTGVTLANGSGTWSSVSDRRSKENIELATCGLKEVMQMKPSSYNYINGSKSLGFIAQEIVEVIPEVVNVPEDKNEMMSVRYSELIPVLTKAIQEQQAQIDALKAEIKELKK
ncbi:endosialidase-like protein [Dyadobacter jejuensis]|uniref:Endosialidase-like protein n=1 Tax=Dyadobacter jejuensis TaxID=1082580 RepID=A0A316A0K7_9BACT|nr:tail fiber domain-containing protein [Dyadobacter jejuensis]PWJ51123.1 endosialidase-like protein [Dyadobacter jejuensis]